jgi:hypothetical protein
MDRDRLVIAFGLVLTACSHRSPSPAADSAAVARHVSDSVLAGHTQAAPALLDSARNTMAQILKHPETARFDSLVVVQPAMQSGSWPAPAVCGRIGGTPGIDGASGMTPFIYRNPVTVFVLTQSNTAAFARLRTDLCDGPGTKRLAGE